MTTTTTKGCFRGDAAHLVDDLIAASQIVPSSTYTGYGRELVAATSTGFFAPDLATATAATTAPRPVAAAPAHAQKAGGRRRSSGGQAHQQQVQQPQQQQQQHAKKQKGQANAATTMTTTTTAAAAPSGLSGCLASSASPRPEALPRPQLLARARRPSPPAASLPLGVAQGHALMQALRCAA